MKGFSRQQFADKEWGLIVVWTPVPVDNDSWGILRPVVGTPWERCFPVVSKQNIEHALRGHASPLFYQMGREPSAWGKALPIYVRTCGESRICPTFDPKKCWPNPSVPECYSPIWDVDQYPGFDIVMAQVVLRWRDNEYVLIALDP